MYQDALNLNYQSISSAMSYFEEHLTKTTVLMVPQGAPRPSGIGGNGWLGLRNGFQVSV